MSDIESKIDELAEMTARGFTELRHEFREEIAELRIELRTDLRAGLRADLREDMSAITDRALRPV